MRLIDADKLLKAPFRITGNFGGKYPFEAITVKMVEAAPIIDPIHAVGGCRCGECRYWDDDGKCEPPENGLIREYTKPTDFCSYGEPREAQDDG